MIKNTGISIDSPKIGEVVFYQPWQEKNDSRRKPYPVIIVHGAYLQNGLISNFWNWQRLTPSGRIKPKIECGYGNFTKASGYSVVRKVVVTK
jgi:hypothetical protein